ncbi:MAG: UDP-N-acetylmuramoyl-L-alanyl-D-glutamate--2,6-diaminopimelate ligase [Firmicutes bacterium]|nr:UDP-N-acetylmuramoyl-L-alanyl-D-glutamate--2,6-diaminopimelate ligase [Bacillota bacterium]
MGVFGITGTNGKTTTSYMTDHILGELGIKSALVGTISHRIGENAYEAINTTPGRELFERYTAEAKRQGIEVIVTEVSSHALVQGRLEGLPVRYAAFTNLSRDHLDYHGDMENYYLAKRKLFDFKTLLSAIINIDDKYGKRLYKELAEGELLKPVGISLSGNADYRATIIEESLDGTEFRVVSEKYGERTFYIAQPGRHNVYDALISTALITERFGEYGFEKASEALRSFEGAPGRFEIIKNGDSGITAVCDYAHTPDALHKLLSSVNDLKRRNKNGDSRVITVFGAGGDRDRGKRPLMGKVAGRLSDIVILTSDNPRSEDPDVIISDIEDGLRTETNTYITDPDRRSAIIRAVSTARRGDIIVVAGKGHETYQITASGREHFDDREILKELLT